MTTDLNPSDDRRLSDGFCRIGPEATRRVCLHVAVVAA